MRFTLLNLIHDFRRFLGAVLAVAISTILICLMFGIMLGLVGLTSAPIDRASAHVWVSTTAAPSCDLAAPISKAWADSLAMDPAITATDEVILSFSFWKDPDFGNVLIMIVGVNLRSNSLGPTLGITEEQRVLLGQQGAVLVDRDDRQRLGVNDLGAKGSIFGRTVRVVGFIEGMPSVTGPYVICSLNTARDLLDMPADLTTFVIGKCQDSRRVPEVQERTRSWQGVNVYSAEEFSTRTRLYWLQTTKAGLGVMFVATLSLLIGTLVTSQTIYTITLASVKELAILRALGAPRWRIRLFVIQHAFVIGTIGVAVGVPTAMGLAAGANAIGVQTIVPNWLLISAAVITLGMALVAGLFALRVLQQTEPGQLLR